MAVRRQTHSRSSAPSRIVRPAPAGPQPRFAHALIATFAVVIAPLAIVILVATTWGIPEPRYLVAPLAGIFLSLSALQIGNALWKHHPVSAEISFKELVLWRYLRRRRAQHTIEFGTRRLSSDGVIDRVSSEERLHLLYRLATAMEAKDRYTHGHSRRVEVHTYRTAMSLGLTRAEMDDLRLAASLHDVGKIEVPDRILRKPQRLDEVEVEIVQRHPVVGAELVSQAVVPRVTSAIRHHHERWDGTGYPDRRAGTDIPMFARIISVADAYDAMTSTRPYRQALSNRAAIADLRENAGVQFDPEIVEAFVQTLQRPVTALGALVILGLPLRAVRRAGTWAHNMGAEAIAGTIGAAGAGALVGIAVVTGGVARQQPAIELVPERPAVAAAAPAPEEPIEVLPTAPPESVERRGSSDRSGGFASSAVASAGTVRTQGVSTVVQGPTVTPPATADQADPEPGGPDDPATPPPGHSTDEPGPSEQGKSKSKGKPAGAGHSPPGDPNPAKGRDCDKPSRGNGKGPQKHCS